MKAFVCSLILESNAEIWTQSAIFPTATKWIIIIILHTWVCWPTCTQAWSSDSMSRPQCRHCNLQEWGSCMHGPTFYWMCDFFWGGEGGMFLHTVSILRAKSFISLYIPWGHQDMKQQGTHNLFTMHMVHPSPMALPPSAERPPPWLIYHAWLVHHPYGLFTTPGLSTNYGWFQMRLMKKIIVCIYSISGDHLKDTHEPLLPLVLLPYWKKKKFICRYLKVLPINILLWACEKMKLCVMCGTFKRHQTVLKYKQ